MPAPASLLFINARVITANPGQPRAEALAVSGNQIAFVGSKADAQGFIGPNTRVIDSLGNTLLPGFIDSHYHLWMGSAELSVADLGGVRTLDDLSQALHQYAQKNPQAAWVCGSHLSYDLLPSGERLTRQHLDAILPDRPIALMSYDYHTMWANTRGMELAGLMPGGQISITDPAMIGIDGLPNGELREPTTYGSLLKNTGAWGRASSALIYQPFPPQDQESLAEDRILLKQGLALAARYGITSLHNMDGNYSHLAFYAALENLGELTCRVYVPYNVSANTSPGDLQEASAMRKDFAKGMAHGSFVKLFMDGVLESWTAFLLDEYADRPGYLGNALYSQDYFNEMATAVDKLGFQMAVHAIGDAAVRRTLDGFEFAREKNSPRDSRHRIEHIELIHEDDIPRFSQLGVIASMQPLHLPNNEADLWRLRAGKNRWKRSFAWQSLRQSGAQLVFGSDWPIVPPGPLPALQIALNRRPWQPGDPEQKQVLDDVIDSFTHRAAYAEFEEHRKGQLKPGMLADLVLLSANLESTPSESLSNLCVVMTVCDGRIVYES